VKLFDAALDAKINTLYATRKGWQPWQAVLNERQAVLTEQIVHYPIAVVTADVASIAETFPGDLVNADDVVSPLLHHFVYLERPIAERVCSFVCTVLDNGAGPRLTSVFFSDDRVPRELDDDYDVGTQMGEFSAENIAMHGVVRLAGDFLERERPDRAQRRRLARAFPDTAEPDRVVTLRLRRVEQRAGGGETTVEWSHRWLVSGHWRRLPKGVVWVRQHVKGPPELPLVVKQHRTLFNR
jgi:hypothetical protein